MNMAIYGKGMRKGMGKGAGAYARIGVENGVMAADSHALIAMLFDAADSAIRSAKVHMSAGNIPAKGEAISRAIDIVNRGLLAVLDRERGGEVAENLARIYDYIIRELRRANLKNDLDALGTVETVLGNIGAAWRELGRSEQGMGNVG